MFFFVYKQVFFFITSFFLFAGYLLTNQQLSETSMKLVFQDQREVDAKVYGIIGHIDEKESVYILTLEDVIISIVNKTKELNYCEKKILVYIPKEEMKFQIADMVRITGKLSEFNRPTNYGQFNEWLYYKSKHLSYRMYGKTMSLYKEKKSSITYYLNCFREQLKAVYQKGLDRIDQGIVTAMITGDQSLLDEDTKKQYQQNGISHILAISGLHISMIGMCFFRILHKLRCHSNWNIIFTMCFLLCYGIMTGFSTSTSRAIIMMMISLLAPLLGRTYDRKSAIAFSGLILIFSSPLLLFQASYLLSFGSILSITYIYPVFEEKIMNYMVGIQSLSKYKLVIQSLLKAFFLSLSIQIGTLPIILFFYYECSPYGILLNLIVLPLMSILVLCAILGGLLGILNLSIGVFFFGAVHVILQCYDKLCQLVESLPQSLQILGRPQEWQLIIYYSLLLLFIIPIKIKKFTILQRYYRMFVLLCLLVLLLPYSKNGLEITFLDVGQGDAIFIQLDGECMLIDCGSNDIKKVGKYRLIPFLKSKGIKKIDYMIMTHADQDHINGLYELLAKEQKDIEVVNLILAKTNYIDDAYEAIREMAVNKKANIIHIKKGDVILLGQKKEKAKVTCLHPDSNFEAFSRNAYSIVFHLEYQQFLALFTGDLEEDGEAMLNFLKQPLSSYHVLKVAHHGSKFSTKVSFLEQVNPRFSIISCGENNLYGHPHKELLDRLLAQGSKVYITYRVGSVTIQSDGTRMQIKPFIIKVSNGSHVYKPSSMHRAINFHL